MKTTKNASVAITGSDLLDRVASDSDVAWRDVIGWNCRELDDLETLEKPTPAEERQRDLLNAAARKEVISRWWIVSWPGHVINQRYNSDAYYAWAGSESEAQREADCVYGA